MKPAPIFIPKFATYFQSQHRIYNWPWLHPDNAHCHIVPKANIAPPSPTGSTRSYQALTWSVIQTRQESNTTIQSGLEKSVFSTHPTQSLVPPEPAVHLTHLWQMELQSHRPSLENFANVAWTHVLNATILRQEFSQHKHVAGTCCAELIASCKMQATARSKSVNDPQRCTMTAAYRFE